MKRKVGNSWGFGGGGGFKEPGMEIPGGGGPKVQNLPLGGGGWIFCITTQCHQDSTDHRICKVFPPKSCSKR